MRRRPRVVWPVGDLWNDGQLSVLITNVYATPSLLVNSVHSGDHGLHLRPWVLALIVMGSAQELARRMARERSSMKCVAGLAIFAK